MAVADIAVLVIIGISVIISLFRGFIKEVLSLIAWVAAFWVAVNYSDRFSPLLEGHVSEPSGRGILAFLGLFIGTLFALGILNFLLSKLVEKTGLTGTDRMLGVLFGVARGIAVVAVLVLAAGATPVPRDSWWRQSTLLPHFEQLAGWCAQFLPASLAEHISYDLPETTGEEVPAVEQAEPQAPQSEESQGEI